MWRSLLLLLTALLSFSPVLAQDDAPPPTLSGAHFKISVLEERGFLDAKDDPNGDVSFSGYLIDMLEAIAIRADFTYDLYAPSGYGSACSPRLGNGSDTTTTDVKPYDASFRTQYNCGAADVNDLPLRATSTDMYLGMYYVNPARLTQNQFTIPFNPPFSGTLAMFGTAIRISSFQDLVEKQQMGLAPEACAPAGTALLDEVEASFPGIRLRGVFGGEEEIYGYFNDGTCEIYITDGPLAKSFVLRRYQQGQCLANGKPIGTIGEPMGFGLSHYAIGIRRDIPVEVVTTISYWMTVLMTCNPLDPEGPCPEGNLASLYDGRGGTGAECGYVLFPQDNALSPMGIVGVVFSSVFVAVLMVVFWHRFRMRRQQRAHAEKERLTKEQAERDRALNEFLAHEVRNPLAAAIAATSFIVTRVSDPKLITSKKKRKKIQEDIQVVDSSLLFISDLMRNMLDLGRGHQIHLNIGTTDVLTDIFQPIASLLLMLGVSSKVEIQTLCPENLFIQTDRMRLKQIILNLATNAVKYTKQGFIRLRAEVRGNYAQPTVYLSVEDSGPGIPQAKRDRLFAKFQESLDVLNQGTGIELCLCQVLSDMMGFGIYLDENYRSGEDDAGKVGSSFVIQTNLVPMQIEPALRSLDAPELAMRNTAMALPENLLVLFADDDVIIRKMFRRTLMKVAPTWTIKEAANGETAIQMTEKENFDLIFMDHYMAALEKQMLGTETVRRLRAKGVKSIICGLSANDKDVDFLEAGANAFMSKPFPTQKWELQAKLVKILYPNGIPKRASGSHTTGSTPTTMDSSGLSGAFQKQEAPVV